MSEEDRRAHVKSEAESSESGHEEYAAQDGELRIAIISR